MARIDKYNPTAGGFRAPLNAAYTGAAAAIGIGLNSSGRVVAGPGQTGIIGVVCSPYDKAAGDTVDCMTNGELVEFGGVAGTRYYAHATTGVISSTPSIYPVGSTVEADRLVVRLGPPAQATNVVGDQTAIVHLTNSTGVVGDDTIADVPALTIAAAAATAVTDAMLTDGTVNAAGVNAELATLAADIIAKIKTGVETSNTIIEDSLADLTDKLNLVLTRLESAGLLTP